MNKWIVVAVLSLVLTGCGFQPHFDPLPSNPSSITINKFEKENPKNQSTIVITGEDMEALYQTLQNDAKHVLPAKWSASCPSYANGTHIWNYTIVVHYPNHSDRSFLQNTDGCTTVKDNQSEAMAMGSLPGLNPTY